MAEEGIHPLVLKGTHSTGITSILPINVKLKDFLKEPSNPEEIYAQHDVFIADTILDYSEGLDESD